MFLLYSVSPHKMFIQNSKMIFTPEKVEFLATLYCWNKDLTLRSFSKLNVPGYCFFFVLHNTTLKFLNINLIKQQPHKITLSIALAMRHSQQSVK